MIHKIGGRLQVVFSTVLFAEGRTATASVARGARIGSAASQIALGPTPVFVVWSPLSLQPLALGPWSTVL